MSRFGGGLRSAKNALARLSRADLSLENDSSRSNSPLRRGGNDAYPAAPGKFDMSDFSSQAYGLNSSGSGGSSPSSTSSRRGLFQFGGRTSKSADPTPDGSPMLRRSLLGSDLTGRSVPAYMRLKGERVTGGSSPLSSRTMSVMSRAEQWLNDL